MHLNRRTLLGRAGLSALLWTPLSHAWARPRRARSARPTLVVGFAAETQDLLDNAKEKLGAKPAQVQRQ